MDGSVYYKQPRSSVPTLEVMPCLQRVSGPGSGAPRGCGGGYRVRIWRRCGGGQSARLWRGLHVPNLCARRERKQQFPRDVSDREPVVQGVGLRVLGSSAPCAPMPPPASGHCYGMPGTRWACLHSRSTCMQVSICGLTEEPLTRCTASPSPLEWLQGAQGMPGAQLPASKALQVRCPKLRTH